jgi:trk system potassium uptake protein
MKKFAILGLGSFGESIAKALTEKGAEVIAIDREMQRVEDIQDYVSIAVKLDSTDENALKSQGIQDVDVAIVCIGEDFESNLLTSVILKQIGVPMVVTRATKAVEEKILNAVGIDRVVLPEREVADKLAYTLMHPNFKEIIYLGGELSIAEFDAPKNFFGKTLEQIHLRDKYGLNLITIHRLKSASDKTTKGPLKDVIMPGAQTLIQEGDTFVVVGKKDDLNKLFSKIS